MEKLRKWRNDGREELKQASKEEVDKAETVVKLNKNNIKF
jgi:hypothetical protein